MAEKPALYTISHSGSKIIEQITSKITKKLKKIYRLKMSQTLLTFNTVLCESYSIRIKFQRIPK